MKLAITFDGGGLRGYLSVRLLEKVAEQVPDLIEKATLLAGTSIGSINACVLADADYEIEDLRKFYHEKAPRVFRDTWWDNIKDLGNFLGAKYEGKNLKKALKDTFSEKKVQQLKKDVLVTAYNLSKCKARYFDHNSSNEEVVHVCMASSAIPLYFPVYKDSSKVHWLDGGVVANNPCAVTLAQLTSEEHKYKIAVQDIHILSIGTGIAPEPDKRLRNADLGWTGLFRRREQFLRVILEAPNESADYQVKQQLGDRYHRLNMPIPPLKLDKIETLATVDRIIDAGKADSTIQKCIDWLKGFIEEVDIVD